MYLRQKCIAGRRRPANFDWMPDLEIRHFCGGINHELFPVFQYDEVG
jgi:hypothetical protein